MFLLNNTIMCLQRDGNDATDVVSVLICKQIEEKSPLAIHVR